MANEHRLRIDIAVIKPMISENNLQSIKRIPGTNRWADCVTEHDANLLNLTKSLEN